MVPAIDGPLGWNVTNCHGCGIIQTQGWIGEAEVNRLACYAGWCAWSGIFRVNDICAGAKSTRAPQDGGHCNYAAVRRPIASVPRSEGQELNRKVGVTIKTKLITG